jgi:hypothetical protein
VSVNEIASGSCPHVAFAAGGYNVSTDSQTNYRGSVACADLLTRQLTISITGALGQDGIVRATDIRRVRSDDDDDDD